MKLYGIDDEIILSGYKIFYEAGLQDANAKII